MFMRNHTGAMVAVGLAVNCEENGATVCVRERDESKD